MSGINYKSQINMPVAPTDDNHVTRLKETKKATFDDTLSVVQIFKKFATPTGGPPWTQPDNFIEAHGDMKIYGSNSVSLWASGTNASARVHQDGVTLRSARFTDWGEDIGLLSEGSAKMYGKQYTTIQSDQQIHIHTHGNDQQVRLACGNTAGLELKRDWQGKQVCEIYTQDKIYLGSDNCEINGTGFARLSAGYGTATVSGGTNSIQLSDVHGIVLEGRRTIMGGTATLQISDARGIVLEGLSTYSPPLRVREIIGYTDDGMPNRRDLTIKNGVPSGKVVIENATAGVGSDQPGRLEVGDYRVAMKGFVTVNKNPDVDNCVVTLRGYSGSELELGTGLIRLEGPERRIEIKGFCNPLAVDYPAVDIVANEGSFIRMKGTTLGRLKFATTMGSHDDLRNLFIAMHGLQWEDIICIRVKNMSTGNITVGRRNEARFTVGDATPIQAYGTTTTVTQIMGNAAMEDFFPARFLRGTINAQSGTQWQEDNPRFVSPRGNALYMMRGDDTVANWGGYGIKPENQMNKVLFNSGGGTWSGGTANFMFGVETWYTWYRPMSIASSYGDWNGNLRFELWTRN